MESERTTNPKLYTESVVALIDLLGFGARIGRAEDDPSQVLMIWRLLKKAQANASEIDRRNRNRTEAGSGLLRALMFSDTILLSYPEVSARGFEVLTEAVMAFQLQGSEEGVFFRGAIAAGSLYQDQDIFFGPAVVIAHEMESKRAVWPRVVLEPSVLSAISSPILDDYVRRDTDGISYLDYLKRTFVVATALEAEHAWRMQQEGYEPFALLKAGIDVPLSVSVFSQHRNAILSALHATEREPKLAVTAKYHALSTYHNEALAELNTTDVVDELVKKELAPHVETGGEQEQGSGITALAQRVLAYSRQELRHHMIELP